MEQRPAAYSETLNAMSNWFRQLEETVPAPMPVPFKDSFVFRYREKTLEQAIIQKLCRVIGGLEACSLLHAHGFIQEQGAMHRIVGEHEEDVDFLSYALLKKTMTKLHQEFLAEFFAESFRSDGSPIPKRPSKPKRQAIRAYCARQTEDPSGMVTASRAITEVNSGYLHGSSVAIMDSCFGRPARFLPRGVAETPEPRVAEFADQLWSYYFRGIGAFYFAAFAFGKDDLAKGVFKFLEKFEHLSGRQA